MALINLPSNSNTTPAISSRHFSLSTVTPGQNSGKKSSFMASKLSLSSFLRTSPSSPSSLLVTSRRRRARIQRSIERARLQRAIQCAHRRRSLTFPSDASSTSSFSSSSQGSSSLDSDSDSDSDSGSDDGSQHDDSDDLSTDDGSDIVESASEKSTPTTTEAATLPPPPHYSHSPFAFPVRLARPVYREVSTQALAAIEPELADVPIEYIRDGLSAQGAR